MAAISPSKDSKHGGSVCNNGARCNLIAKYHKWKETHDAFYIAIVQKKQKKVVQAGAECQHDVIYDRR